MKMEWNKKYTTIAIYTCIVILFAVFIIFFFINYSDFSQYISSITSVLSPILSGIIIAYILNPVVRFFEKKVFGGGKKKASRSACRALGILFAYLIVLAVITGFILILIPQLTSGYRDLVNNLSGYVSKVQEWLTKIGEQSQFFSEQVTKIIEYINSIIDSAFDIFKSLMPKVSSAALSVVVFLKDGFLGLIMAIYFLLTKEKIIAQIKKFIHAFISEKRYDRLMEFMRLGDKTFGKYITGTLLDSLLVGVICFILMSIFGLPYPMLISVMIMITNIIPFFGPFIGAIPSAFIIFVVNPMQCIVFVVMILVLQQIDGNFILPRIHGSTTGLSSTWVIVSITVMSGFFGVLGMFIGVPIFAMIYSLIKAYVESRLRAKEMPTATVEYFSGTEARLLYEERDNKLPLKDRLWKHKYIQVPCLWVKKMSVRGFKGAKAWVLPKLKKKTQKHDDGEAPDSGSSGTEENNNPKQ